MRKFLEYFKKKLKNNVPNKPDLSSKPKKPTIPMNHKFSYDDFKGFTNPSPYKPNKNTLPPPKGVPSSLKL